MSDSKKLLSVSAFEWASVAKYIVYISSVMGLCEINSNRVISFALSRIGSDKLLKQKKLTLSLLEGNKSKVERFVGERQGELGGDELAVLRSLYLQYKSSGETVQGHIDFIEECMVEQELSLLMAQAEGEDDLLF